MHILQHHAPNPDVLGDLVPLLAQTRRDYDAAVTRGDLRAATRYERIYRVLFERRRRGLLAQAARRGVA